MRQRIKRHSQFVFVAITLLAVLSVYFSAPAAGQQIPSEPGDMSGGARLEPVLSYPDPGSPEAPEASEAIDCNDSPFGRVVEVGGEKEVFVSYQDGAFQTPNFRWLRADLLDANASDELVSEDEWLQGSLDADLQTVDHVTSATADLNGDGRDELVQAFTDASDEYRLLSTSAGTPVAHELWASGITGSTEFVAASGNLDDSADLTEEVVVASRQSDGNINVFFWHGDGAGGFGPADGQVSGIWRSSTLGRNNVLHLSIDVGDVTGDGKDEIVVAFLDRGSGEGDRLQIVVLQHAPEHDVGAGNDREFYLELLTYARFESFGEPLNLTVATGDTDGDYKDEIVLAWDQPNIDGDTQSYRQDMRVYDVNVAESSTNMDLSSTWFQVVTAFEFAMTTGDTDRDGLEEIVIAYTDVDADPDEFHVVSLNAEFEDILEQSEWVSTTNNQPFSEDVHVTTGDMDKDGFMDIVVAFLDTTDQLQVLYLKDQNTPGLGIQLADAWTKALKTWDITVNLGDWDDDTILAELGAAEGTTLECKTVHEPQILSTVFLPPFWQNIQGDQNHSGSVGRTRDQASTNETGLTSYSSHSVSAYIGGGAGGEVFGIGAEATLRVTAGYEYASSQTQAGGTTQGQSITEGWIGSEGDGLIVAELEEYDCYNYQLRQQDVAIDGQVRFCEYKSRTQSGGTLESWEIADGNQAGISLQWAPVARDWSNLALFKGNAATQSSIGSSGSASRAVDGDTNGHFFDGSVTHTAEEAQPWWQLDLGRSEAISKIRVWNRSDCCRERLVDFYVFVSDSPFTSDDPAVLAADPDVQAYYHEGYVPRVATFLTRDVSGAMLTGRYVRVQLTGTGILSLAEVQIFGANHVEPDRYPVAVRDDEPRDDGEFEVQLYDPSSGQYHWVPMRGNLVWSGVTDDPVWSNVVIRQGGGEAIWSLSTYTTTFSRYVDSYSHEMRVGAEFDSEAGIIGKVIAGGGYEYTTGVTEDTVRETSWGTSFELEGRIQGFPAEYNAVPWSQDCNYGMQPYTYEIVEESTFGYRHRFMIVDYVVPQDKLDRTAINPNCHVGLQTADPDAPVLTSPADGATTNQGRPGFDWQDVAGATEYRLEIDDTPAFSAPEISATVTGSTFTPASALSNGLYYWRVQANDGGGWGAWSTIWSVTVDATSPPGDHFVYLPILTR